MKPRQTDLTFFTNDETGTLLDRFKATLKDARFFDVLAGYFRAGGFYQLHEAIAPLDKVRILVGLGVDRESFQAVNSFRTQSTLDFESRKSARTIYQNSLIDEIETTGEPDEKLEIGVRQFLQLLQTNCPDPEKDSAAGETARSLRFGRSRPGTSTPRSTSGDLRRKTANSGLSSPVPAIFPIPAWWATGNLTSS